VIPIDTFMAKKLKSNASAEELLTMKEASKLLKVSEISIKRYVSKGVIPSIKIGGARRIVQNEVWDSLVEYHKTENEEIPEVTNGVQFYWSQKKPEIAQRIYRENCKDGQIIFDPFLGAGSSLYGVRGSNYKFIGIDINELPYRIAKFNIKKNDEKTTENIKNEITALKEKFNDIYHYPTKSGKTLEFIKIIFDEKEKPKVQTIFFQDFEGNKFTSADYPETIKEFLRRYEFYSEKLNKIENPLLTKNSRIAIKENMRLADIFSPINFFVLSELKTFLKNNPNLKFILGSILHLCKLTDTKSQSQFPFWIPKTEIVDRNIFLTLLNKVNALAKLIGQEEIPEKKTFEDLKFSFGSACLLFNKPIQKITAEDIPDNSVDFILTDPPYFDQVAYSEYLKIWEHFLEYKSHFKDEIIVSQRETETSTEKDYLNKLESAFQIIYNKLKPNAKMFIYFKDSRLGKMGAFLQILDKVGFTFVEQEHLDTAKFTYKQNTSTKTTIAGECILKLSKTQKHEELNGNISSINESSTKNLITYFVKSYLLQNGATTLGEIFNNGLVKTLYENKALGLLKDSKTVVSIIEEFCNYDESNRSYKLKNSEFKNQLYLGECVELLKKIPSKSIDCCITDPPYNISGYDHKKKIGWLNSNNYWKEDKAFKKIDENWDKFKDDDYDKFTADWLIEIKRILKPNGNIAIFGSYHNIYKIGYLLEKLELKIINSIVWYKRNAFPNITQRMFCESTEYIIWATNNSKKEAKNWTFNYNTMKELNGGVQMRNLFDVPITKQSERKEGKHPSQKPLEVLNNLILALTNEGDTIIDPFIGSGTTGVSAIQNKRNFVGIDKSFEYLEISERRIANVDPIIFNSAKNKSANTLKQTTIFDER
jgi:site-specific DNA-methyltransferase (adenine-specific)